MKVKWTHTAKKSLNQVYEFLNDVWGNRVADHFLQLVDAKINSLAKRPEIGKKHLNRDFRSILIHKHIRLFYHIGNSEIVLLTFWDNRQDPVRLAESLIKKKP